MFTGLIEEVGVIARVQSRSGARRVAIQCSRVLEDLTVGASVAVNGVCLTVTSFDRTRFEADAVGDTLVKTTLPAWTAGRRVHLERAVRADARLGGHVVQGHVQGTAKVLVWTPGAGAATLEIALPPAWLSEVVPEGSIAIDGVSLTIAEVTGRGVRLSIIPETRRSTTFDSLVPGQLVNVELDAALRPRAAHLTLERLHAWGYR